MSQDERRFFERQRDEALMQRNSFRAQHDDMRLSIRRTEDAQAQLRNTNANLEERLNGVVRTIRVFEVDISSSIGVANRCASDVNLLYHSTFINNDFIRIDLGQAFRTPSIEEEATSSIALQECHNEKTRIETDIARINSEVTRLSATIAQMNSDATGLLRNAEHFHSRAVHFQGLLG